MAAVLLLHRGSRRLFVRVMDSAEKIRVEHIGGDELVCACMCVLSVT